MKTFQCLLPTAFSAHTDPQTVALAMSHYLNIKLLYDYAFKHFINIKTFYRHNDSSILLTARSFIGLDGAGHFFTNRRRGLLK